MSTELQSQMEPVSTPLSPQPITTETSPPVMSLSPKVEETSLNDKKDVEDSDNLTLKAEDQPKEPAQVAPEKYTVNVPDNFRGMEGTLEANLAPFAKKANLSQEQFDELTTNLLEGSLAPLRKAQEDNKKRLSEMPNARELVNKAQSFISKNVPLSVSQKLFFEGSPYSVDAEVISFFAGLSDKLGNDTQIKTAPSANGTSGSALSRLLEENAKKK